MSLFTNKRSIENLIKAASSRKCLVGGTHGEWRWGSSNVAFLIAKLIDAGEIFTPVCPTIIGGKIPIGFTQGSGYVLPLRFRGQGNG